MEPTTESIYGRYSTTLPIILKTMTDRLSQYNEEIKAQQGDGVYEHMIARVKTEESMREKCVRKGLPETTHSALIENTDAIGLRIITRFVDDIYDIISYIRDFDDCEIIEEKDYIRNAKPNGYRSYHLILELTVPYEDIRGNNPGKYYVEIQLRTIAMDMWASLEHQLNYKKNIRAKKMIADELKRCADELASCDISMQTIRGLIREAED